MRADPIPATRTYEFRVAGHLDDHWSAWLGGVTVARRADGTSAFTVPLADQARLHGILDRLRDMGATLLAVNALAGGDGLAVNALADGDGLAVNALADGDGLAVNALAGGDGPAGD